MHAGDALTVAWRRHAAAIAAANCARVSAGDAPANPATTARAQPRKSCASAPNACASMRTAVTAVVVSTAAASMSMSTGCRDDATSAGDGEEEDIEEGSTRKDIEEGSTKRGTERRRGRWTKNPEANRGRPCTTCNVGDVRSAGSVTMRRTERRSGAETWLDEAARRGGEAVRRHERLRRQPPSFDGGLFIGSRAKVSHLQNF